MIFWTALTGSGFAKIVGKLNNKAFAQIMEVSQPFFKLFTASGLFILLGLATMILGARKVIRKKERNTILAKDADSLLELDTIL